VAALGGERGVVGDRAKEFAVLVGAAQDVLDAAAGVDLVAEEQRARRSPRALGALRLQLGAYTRPLFGST